MINKASRSLFLWTIAFIVYSFVYGLRLNYPPSIYNDEYYIVTTARQILHLDGYFSPHPPLGPLIVSLCINFLGDSSWVWRLFSFFSGFGCIALVFLIMFRLTSHPKIAFVAAFLFSLDGLTVVLSRVASLNSLMLFFMLLSVYFLLLCLNHSYKTKFLIFSALSLGLALATRWVALASIVPLAMIFIRIYRENHPNQRRIFFDLIPALAALLLAYILPFIVFVFIKDHNWWSAVMFQKEQFFGLLSIPDTSKSPFWSWPLLVKPVRFYFSQDLLLNTQQGVQINFVHIVMALSNPMVVWFGLVALIALFFRSFKKIDWTEKFILVCFFSWWMIPCAFITRHKYSYYFYPAMPFLCMALAVFLKDMFKEGSKIKIPAFIYLGLVLGMFVYWYPFWTGMPMTKASYNEHIKLIIGWRHLLSWQ